MLSRKTNLQKFENQLAKLGDATDDKHSLVVMEIVSNIKPLGPSRNLKLSIINSLTDRGNCNEILSDLKILSCILEFVSHELREMTSNWC